MVDACRSSSEVMIVWKIGASTGPTHGLFEGIAAKVAA